jgi:seryl-tRNA synthetase
MHARRLVEDQPELIAQALQARNNDFDLESLVAGMAARKRLRQELEALQARRNSGSKEVGQLFKSGRGDEAQVLRAELAAIGKQVTDMETEVKELETVIDDRMLGIPNLVAADVPVGTDEASNTFVRAWGEPRSFDFKPRDHHDLGVQLGILDFERGAKVTGARFTFLKGAASLLNRALINLMLDLATRERGYLEVQPPAVVNSASLTGTGQLPKFAEDLFRLDKPDDYWLSPTAEVQITNLHRKEILEAAELPIRYAAYSPCFRSEAGSYGKDTRGLIRQHQFDKVELVHFVRPELAEQSHEELTAGAEAVLQRLGLPYRVATLCSGDLGFSALKCYDLEVWLPGQDKYREISSCSNFGQFQARRASIRFRPEPGAKPEFVATLNGSALAVGRTLLAVLENYQQADGSVVVPEALRTYMHGLEVIEPA